MLDLFVRVSAQESDEVPRELFTRYYLVDTYLINLSPPLSFSERTATIVHGETGHIACCLTCARILKARGDNVSRDDFVTLCICCMLVFILIFNPL